MASCDGDPSCCRTLIYADFPRLQEDGAWEIRSDTDELYNCIGWAAGQRRRWWPWDVRGWYWPLATKEETVPCFKSAFAMKLGYETCGDGSLEAGWEKVALYVRGEKPTHMARQLESGLWTSKLGNGHDIVHAAPESLDSEVYGSPKHFMRRRRHGQQGQA